MGKDCEYGFKVNVKFKNPEPVVTRKSKNRSKNYWLYWLWQNQRTSSYNKSKEPLVMTKSKNRITPRAILSGIIITLGDYYLFPECSLSEIKLDKSTGRFLLFFFFHSFPGYQGQKNAKKRCEICLLECTFCFSKWPAIICRGQIPAENMPSWHTKKKIPFFFARKLPPFAE